ncbi:MAG: hypothetical protein FWD94_03200, partial [Treponema sp.]|nr:hypothetical protein [Treponema sp.]
MYFLQCQNARKISPPSAGIELAFERDSNPSKRRMVAQTACRSVLSAKCVENVPAKGRYILLNPIYRKVDWIRRLGDPGTRRTLPRINPGRIYEKYGTF